MNFRKKIDFRKALSNRRADFFFLELVILTCFVILYCYFSEDINECFIYKDIENIEVVSQKLSSEKTSALMPESTFNENIVYSAMHKMANTKITAEDGMIWGSIAINEKNINIIRSVVEKIDYKDRPYLMAVLKRWDNKNFEYVSQEHNYFWEMLGGTVGRAIDNYE